MYALVQAVFPQLTELGAKILFWVGAVAVAGLSFAAYYGYATLRNSKQEVKSEKIEKHVFPDARDFDRAGTRPTVVPDVR